MKSIAETERLRLREFTRDDAPFLLELLNTPEWIRFIGDRNIRTLDDARDYVSNRLIASYHRFGFGLYKVELKVPGTATGMWRPYGREALDDVGPGFAFCPDIGSATHAAGGRLLFRQPARKLSRSVSGV